MTAPPDRPPRHGRPWSDADRHLLVYLWDALELGALARRLGRRPGAVLSQAAALGLRTTQGRLTITQAAARAGVDAHVVKRLVRLGLLRARRGHQTGRTRRPHLYVGVDDLDAAVATYVAGETCLAAARRRGVEKKWLQRRLVAAGVWCGTFAARYPTAVIDAAVAAYAGRKTR